jgi:hypothetical protein
MKGAINEIVFEGRGEEIRRLERRPFLQAKAHKNESSMSALDEWDRLDSGISMNWKGTLDLVK